MTVRDTNVASALTAQAVARPDAPALILPQCETARGWAERRYSYRELDDLSTRAAAGLHRIGIAPGTRVAFMVPPSLEFFVLFFALFKAGAVPVLIDPGIGLKPLKACLGEAKPEAFIGITKAHVARLLLGWAKGYIKTLVTIGPRLGWGGVRYGDLPAAGNDFQSPPFAGDDPAAILFTSGSTGLPKGVVYRHRHFAAQVELMRDTFGMRPGEVDLPTFPPFALFDPALGMTTVVPVMDFTRPARVDPSMLVSLIEHYRVTNLFGSPALMNTLTRHLDGHDIRLPRLRRVLSAGAPVPPKVIERMHRALDGGADIHTPYGATECLPVATIAGRELTGALSEGNREGRGVCVGCPLPANRVRIIGITDEAVERLEDASEAAQGEVGEICVHGPTVTDTYWGRPERTRSAKMRDEHGNVWHRMGDLGRIDDDGRLWFCGRKSERVRAESGDLFTEQAEGIFNAHPCVFRSALVGVGEPGKQRPVLLVEAETGADKKALRKALLALAGEYEHTRGIRTLMFHKGFPVDIRHNAKIKRGMLAEWAAKRLARRDENTKDAKKTAFK